LRSRALKSRAARLGGGLRVCTRAKWLFNANGDARALARDAGLARGLDYQLV
jgi:hypothetical protein